MNNRTIFFGTAGALFLLVAIFAVGYQLRWWLREDAINRQAEINRDSFEFQETARSEIIDLASDLAELEVTIAHPDLTPAQVTAFEAQQDAIADRLCEQAARISGDVTPAVDRAILTYC